MTTTRRRVRAALVGVALGLSACSAGTSDSTATDSSAPGGDSPGLTDDTIKVGVVLLDLRRAEPLGLGLDNHELETQRAVFEALIGVINDAGGIAGRSIEPVFVDNDPLDADAARAGCLSLTQDEKVFAVVGYVTGAMECVTEEHGTPLIIHSTALDALYEDSGNRLISPQASLERIASSWAAVMAETIADSEVAIVATDDGGTQELAADALQQALEQRGHAVDHRVRVTEATSASAMEMVVPQMRTDGVEAVFLSTDFATASAFVRVAEQQGFAPQYLTSEIGSLASDGLVRRMPASFDGAIGVTSALGSQVAARAGTPAPPVDAECIDQYNTAAGDDVAWGDEHPVIVICGMLRIFEAAAKAAGEDLSQASFTEAAQQLGSFELPGRQGGSFGPGKTDYSDVFQMLRWSKDCTCYDVFGEPVTVG